MKIIKTFTIEHEPTPAEVANEFWAMDDTEQAEFFNALNEIAGSRIAMQLQYVTDNGFLTTGARVLMQTIGEYGE